MNFHSPAIKSDIIICFSHLRWNFVYQRPQHLLSRAARSHQVFFVEEPLFTDTAQPDLAIQQVQDGIWTAVPELPRNYNEEMSNAAIAGLVEAMVTRLRGNRVVLWYYTPMALPIGENIPADLWVYDNMDELSLFRGASPHIVDLENKLLQRADLVFTGGRSLFEAKRNRHPAVHLFPSSIDTTHFGSARSQKLSEPADQMHIGYPRVGFFGVIDERMDLQLLEEVALMRPDWQFVMIGPVVKIDANTLPKLPNLFWLGGKAYADLPQYLARWNLGMMPFALNESTRFISPTKTPEFLAAALPVISTPIRDVVRPYGELGLVEIASTATDFVAKAAALMARDKAPWLTKVDNHLSHMSWDLTWDEMAHLIESTLHRPKKQYPPIKADAAAHV